MGGPDSKISTVDVESGDNMATLPVSRAHTSSTDTAEKNNAANKEMELKNVMPKPLERYYPANWLNGISLKQFLKFISRASNRIIVFLNKRKFDVIFIFIFHFKWFLFFSTLLKITYLCSDTITLCRLFKHQDTM